MVAFLAIAIAAPTPELTDEATQDVPTRSELQAADVPPEVQALPFVAFSQLKVVDRIDPTYPDGAEEENIESIHCTVHVHVSPLGRTKGVWVAECPKIFHPNTEKALSGWTWTRPTNVAVNEDLRTELDLTFAIVPGEK